MTAGIAPLDNLCQGAQLVHLTGLAQLLAGALGESAAANGVYRPFFQEAFIGPESLEQHAVGMILQKTGGLPDNLYRADGLQHFQDGNIRHMALAGGGEGAVESNLEAGCFGVTLSE